MSPSTTLSPLRVKQKLQSAKGPTAGRMKSYSGVKQNVVSASKYLPSFHVHFINQRIDLLRSLVLSSSEPLLASNSTINNVPLSKSTSCHSLCYWDKLDRTHTVFRTSLIEPTLCLGYRMSTYLYVHVQCKYCTSSCQL